AAGWVTGIENSLEAGASPDTATSSRVRDAASRLDEQVKLLSGPDSETAIAQLPDVINSVVDELKPVRDAVCG
ncbi:hypothetical protein SB767_29800, partial [Bacillus sp. SIMBA_069]